MEGAKRAAAVAALCMLILLTLAKPPHQQLSDAVCECYRQCYAGCKDITWPRVCKVECAGGCGGANGDGKLGTCMIACSMDPVCGLSTAPVGKKTLRLLLLRMNSDGWTLVEHVLVPLFC